MGLARPKASRMVCGILRGEQHPHDLAAILVVLEDLLADQLAFAIAVGGQPDPLGRPQRLANGLQLGGLVAARRRPRAVKPVGPQQDRRPALPRRHDVLRLLQVDQMALGREDVAVARADGGADVFRLAGLLGDDDLIGHDGSKMGANSVVPKSEHKVNYFLVQEQALDQASSDDEPESLRLTQTGEWSLA